MTFAEFSRVRVVRAVALWFVLSAAAGVASLRRYAIDTAPLPSDGLTAWGLAYLGGANEEPSESWQGPGPNVITAWRAGLVAAQYIGEGDLVEDVRAAREQFAALPSGEEGWLSEPLIFSIEVGLGEGPVHLDVPYLRELSLVPLHEGLIAELDGERRVLSPDTLRAAAAYDGGIATPIPDLGLGTDVRALAGRMARDMGRRAHELFENGRVRRYRSKSYANATYPRSVPVDAAHLEEAVRDAAAFLLRHQGDDGIYTYIYDARADLPVQAGYNIPRHSGTTYFLAQVSRVLDVAEARRGALNALAYLERNHVQRCGEHLCLADNGRVDVGSAALTVVAAAEVLMGGEDARARRLLEGLSGFLRAQQRADGELMHEFDLQTGEPVDVQHLYYSGEAAFALLRAYRATHDEANLDAVSRLMVHLTGASWDFFGSRYYYGEEHWTCIAAGEGIGLERQNGEPAEITSAQALDFCKRWYEWNDVLQFRAGETPWPVEGAYGVGPIVVPRLTPVGSRSEAFIGTFLMMRDAGMDTRGVRALVERGLGQLLRYRWAPGPTHLFANPEAAYGAVPGSPIDLTSRNDFTQHAGSSWIRWLEVLREDSP